MRMKAIILAVVAAAALVPAAPAGEFDKYLPADCKLYVHVTVPKFFTSQMVRKTVPMAFEKYGDDIAGHAGALKGIPNLPVNEDQIKQVLKQLADAQFIAEICDQAKDMIKDVVVAGTPTADGAGLVTLIRCEHFTVENIDAITGLLALAPQAAAEIKITKLEKPKGAVWAINIVKAGQKLYLCIPTAGLLQISMTEKAAEFSLEGAGKPDPKLAGCMAKQNPADFVFVATTTGPDFDTLAVNVVLDANLSANVACVMTDEGAADSAAKMVKDKINEVPGMLKGAIGPVADLFKPHIEKAEVTTSGKTLTAKVSIPGSAVESALKKEAK